jgi:hypothetical protein
MPAIAPLPSLIRASAHDAASMAMRKANRKKWSRDDFNLAVSTQERLIRACYGKEGDNQPEYCYIRFQIAEQMERAGEFHLKSDLTTIMARIDDILAA